MEHVTFWKIRRKLQDFRGGVCPKGSCNVLIFRYVSYSLIDFANEDV